MGVNYQRLNLGDITIGKPVPWALYDENRKLLLARGVKLQSERQLQALMERGLFRIVQGGSPTVSGPVDEAPAPREDIRQLEDVRLSIGDTLQMQSRAEGDASRHYVKLIGYMKGKAVLVGTPMVNGQVQSIREGQGFVCRLFAGKSVYAFATSVQRVTNVPFPHLYLEYPREVRGLVVRRGARARVQIIASVTDRGGRSSAAQIVDLSIGGAMLTAKAPVADRNSEIVLKFRVDIHGVEQYLAVPGVVRSIRAEAGAGAGAEGTRYQHGIEFKALAPPEQVALSGYVYQRLFEESAEL